jgi:phage terminase Nu1 subunit (DNA packaging protein)
VIAPAEPRRGARPSRWNLADCARKILAHTAELTPRDRREQAQAQLLELRYRRESREVLERATVIRKGVAVAKTVSAHLTSLPSRMVKDGLVPPEHEAAIDGYIRERLDELSRLADEHYLAEDDENADDQP